MQTDEVRHAQVAMLSAPSGNRKARATVRTADGQAYVAEHVVLSVPPSVWGRIAITPALPPALAPQMGPLTCVLERRSTFDVKVKNVLARQPLPELLLITDQGE